MARAEEGFCDWCDVSLDLHPSEEQMDDPWECEVATMKADTLSMFGKGLR